MAKLTQKETNGLFELTDVARSELQGNAYYNEDLAPTKVENRTWSTYHITALWIGMAICIPSFTMASGLVSMGLSPWLAVLNVTLGNLIVLIPMQLNSHAGTKYGIPFPVFARMTFGPRGAHIPSLSRAITACGWCAIQSWIGGAATVKLISVFYPPFNDFSWAPYFGFFLFLLLVLYISISGSEAIKAFESWSAPILTVLTLGVLVWSTMIASEAGFSVGDIMRANNNPELLNLSGGGIYVFLAGLTANISFWATMALNIPDFSRYAQSQKAQFRGQLYGMPLFMFACAFVGAYMGQATQLAYGVAIFDPTEILAYLDHPVVGVLVSIGVIVATLTTNIAANVIAPANGFSNLMPKKISYKTGVIATVILAVVYQPWHLLGAAANLFFFFINTYGSILAPIAAIFIADYYMVKKRRLDVMALFQGESGRYWYSGGFNNKAIIAWVAGFILPLIGKILQIAGSQNSFFHWVEANGYLFGFVVALIVYTSIMDKNHASFVTEEQARNMTETKSAV